MADVFDLQAKIGLNTSDFTKGLATAGTSMKEFGSTIKSGAETVAKVGVAAFTAVAGAATATSAAILKGVDALTTYGDNIDKMSQKLGMSAQAYQEWDAVMQHSGTTIDSMQASMKTLASAAETGNDAFEKLGITQEEIANMSQEELFSATITALQNLDNETERTYLAGQLLGRGATELGALLNTSAEDTEKMKQRVHELGGVMSDEAVKASAKYKDSIQDMKTAFKGIGRDLISDFVPALTEVSDGLTAIFSGEENGVELFTQGFDKAIQNIGQSAAKIKPIVKKIGSIAVQVIPEIIGTVGESIINAIPDMLGSGGKLLEKIANSIENANLNGSGITSKLLDAIIGNVGDYFKYGEKIIANIGNAIINADHTKLGQTFSKIVTTGINSITNLLVDLDMKKVGQNIADFLNAVDWKEIAKNLIDLIGSAIGSLGDIASSFFENADLGNLMTMIGVLGAPKLLGGINTFIGGSEGKELGGLAGQSWSSAFMAGIQAFGLGWAIGTYLRDNITFGDKTLGEWIDYALWNDSGAAKVEEEEQNKEDYGMFTYADGRQGLKYDVESNTGLSEAFLKAAESGNVQYQNIAERVQAMQGAVNRDNELSDFYFEPHTDTYKNQNTLADLLEFEKQAKKDIRYTAQDRTNTQNVSYGMPQAILDMINNRYAVGGYVNQPQFALIGEKEPEYIIPESKMDNVYPRGEITNNFNIHIEGYNVENDQRLVELISEKLQNLSITQQRALGGAGWQ